MKHIHFTLFGNLSVHYDKKPLNGCDSLKVRELLAYLLLNRDRPHTREALASLLWGDSCTTARSKKYLRNALWRLNSAIDRCPELTQSNLIIVNAGSIELRTLPTLWVDTAVFEQAYGTVKGSTNHDLSSTNVTALRTAIDLYTAPLLSSWHQDWCTVERNRLHHMYLLMLEKLSGYYEQVSEYEMALSYAERILHSDRAHEAAHRRIMRLFLGMGDRTSALRQYAWCVDALRDELDAVPAPATKSLYEMIRTSPGSALAS